MRQCPLRNDHLFRKTAIGLHTEHPRIQTHRFFALFAILALPAKQIRLNGYAMARLPARDLRSRAQDGPCDFATGRARQFNRNRERAFFGPKVEVIESTCFDLDDDFSRTGLRVRQFTHLKLSGFPMSD